MPGAFLSQTIGTDLENFNSNLVSVSWLNAHLRDANLVVLDATMKFKPDGSPVADPAAFIPGALEFNFDTVICDQNTQLPHMLCSVEQFEEAAQELGINIDSIIVVYDAMGIFSSPRAWWMFKIMGFKKVFVVNGGLPEWINAQLPTTSALSQAEAKGNFKAKFHPSLISSLQQVVDSITDAKTLVCDARSLTRFSGEESEPREGLRRGHIPNSNSLPYTELFEKGLFKQKQQLELVFSRINNTFDEVIFSCGSGVTACILALAATESGYNNWSIYD